MQITVKNEIAVIQDAEEDILSFLPRIKDYLIRLEEIRSNTSKEFESILKQIGEEELTEKDANILLEQATEMVDSTRELTRDLRIRLMEAAAVIEEREPPDTIRGSRAYLLEQAVALAKIP